MMRAFSRRWFWACLPSLAVLLAAERAPAADEAGDRIKDAEVASFVDQRVQKWQPTVEEKRFDEIAWVHTVIEAEKLAREHSRPIFLFTHDGKMNVGRC
jgi:hypothetical protein